jgi:iron complex transport system substrate-binding protein
MPRCASSTFLRRTLAVVSFVTAACAGETPADEHPEQALPEGINVVDASGSQRFFATPARRVISLVPSATQTLRALRTDSLLVGRTDFDVQDWLAHLPSVGGGLQPNLEEIVALSPDLVIRFHGEQDSRTPARLDDLGIMHIAVRPDRLQDLYAGAILLGRVTGADSAADSLVRALEAGLAELSQRVEQLPRLRAVYVLGGTPPWVAGPDTYIDEIIRLVGGDNAFQDLGVLYSAVSPEELRAREIDVVLVSDASQFDATLTPQARIVEIGDALEIPGPHVVDAAWRVAELLHGTSLR